MKLRNTVNISILPPITYRFNVIPIKITALFLLKIDKFILKFILKYKMVISNKKKSDVKTLKKITVIKTLGY